MRDTTLHRGLLLLALSACPWACSEGEGAGAGSTADAGDVTPPPDAAEASAHDAGEEDAEALPTCSDGGFCITALPTGEILYSVWGSEDGSVWAGGTRSIFHFDGVAWQPAFTWPEGGAPGIRAKILVGTGPEDVWAFGDGPEFDPLQFPHPAVAHLARRGSELAWRAVTTDLKILSGSIGTAWAASPTDLWVAWGYQGLWHVHGEDNRGHVAAEPELDGDGRHRLDSPSGIWGFGPDRIFASGYDSREAAVLLRRALDGGWVKVPGATAGTPWYLAGTAAGAARLWVYDGWTTRVHGIGADGALLTPELQRNGADVPECRPNLVSAVRSDLVWLSDGTTVCRYENGSFQIVPITVGPYPRFKVNAVWSNGTDTWIVGEEKPRLEGGPGRGFALHHKGGS